MIGTDKKKCKIKPLWMRMLSLFIVGWLDWVQGLFVWTATKEQKFSCYGLTGEEVENCGALKGLIKITEDTHTFTLSWGGKRQRKHTSPSKVDTLWKHLWKQSQNNIAFQNKSGVCRKAWRTQFFLLQLNTGSCTLVWNGTITWKDLR